MEEVEQKIEDINTKLDLILEILNSNQSSNKKLVEHIDFIENVYENVKNPLNFICNKVSYLTRGEKSPLPAIKVRTAEKEADDYIKETNVFF